VDKQATIWIDWLTRGNHQIDVGGLNENARDRNRLCIEVSCRQPLTVTASILIRMTASKDPFETPYNVARTVTKDGLYTVSAIVKSLARITNADQLGFRYVLDSRRVHACNQGQSSRP
jgi:hypothetical protein